jgi:hypothetical protein
MTTKFSKEMRHSMYTFADKTGTTDKDPSSTLNTNRLFIRCEQVVIKTLEAYKCVIPIESRDVKNTTYLNCIICTILYISCKELFCI